jgi:hypothetical protein
MNYLTSLIHHLTGESEPGVSVNENPVVTSNDADVKHFILPEDYAVTRDRIDVENKRLIPETVRELGLLLVESLPENYVQSHIWKLTFQVRLLGRHEEAEGRNFDYASLPRALVDVNQIDHLVWELIRDGEELDVHNLVTGMFPDGIRHVTIRMSFCLVIKLAPMPQSYFNYSFPTSLKKLSINIPLEYVPDFSDSSLEDLKVIFELVYDPIIDVSGRQIKLPSSLIIFNFNVYYDLFDTTRSDEPVIISMPHMIVKGESKLDVVRMDCRTGEFRAVKPGRMPDSVRYLKYVTDQLIIFREGSLPDSLHTLEFEWGGQHNVHFGPKSLPRSLSRLIIPNGCDELLTPGIFVGDYIDLLNVTSSRIEDIASIDLRRIGKLFVRELHFDPNMPPIQSGITIGLMSAKKIWEEEISNNRVKCEISTHKCNQEYLHKTFNILRIPPRESQIIKSEGRYFSDGSTIMKDGSIVVPDNYHTVKISGAGVSLCKVVFSNGKPDQNIVQIGPLHSWYEILSSMPNSFRKFSIDRLIQQDRIPLDFFSKFVFMDELTVNVNHLFARNKRGIPIGMIELPKKIGTLNLQYTVKRLNTSMKTILFEGLSKLSIENIVYDLRVDMFLYTPTTVTTSGYYGMDLTRIPNSLERITRERTTIDFYGTVITYDIFVKHRMNAMKLLLLAEQKLDMPRTLTMSLITTYLVCKQRSVF